MNKIMCWCVAFFCILSVFCSPTSLYAMRRNRAGEVQEPMQAQAVVKRYFFGAIPFALFFGSVKVIINFLTHDFPSLLNFNAVKCEETFTALKDVCKESIVSICGNLTKVN